MIKRRKSHKNSHFLHLDLTLANCFALTFQFRIQQIQVMIEVLLLLTNCLSILSLQFFLNFSTMFLLCLLFLTAENSRVPACARVPVPAARQCTDCFGKCQFSQQMALISDLKNDCYGVFTGLFFDSTPQL